MPALSLMHANTRAWLEPSGASNVQVPASSAHCYKPSTGTWGTVCLSYSRSQYSIEELRTKNGKPEDVRATSVKVSDFELTVRKQYNQTYAVGEARPAR